jgi:ankyrin repeat protein
MQRDEIIDAVCAWGWDRPSTATPARAEAAIATAPRGDFVLACITGDVDAVRAALARDPSLATAPCAPRAWPPLVYACFSVLGRAGQPRAARLVEIAELLLAHGADANAAYPSREPGDDSKFPVLYAAIAVVDNLALAAALLAAGADPNDGQSLYHAAERFDNDALDLLHAHGLGAAEISYNLLHKIDFQFEPGIRWFLDHGADPNARHPQSGEAALHWAIKRASRREVVELIIAHGADVNAHTGAGHTLYPNVRGTTPIDLARRLARPDLVELFRARGGRETPPTTNDAFVFACLEGTPATGDVARLSAADRSLLTHVAQQNQTAAALRLAEAGWPLDARGWMDATALHWAACRGNAELARGLLARGAPLVDVGGYFQTPVHTAIHCRWLRDGADPAGVLAALAAAGASVPPGATAP